MTAGTLKPGIALSPASKVDFQLIEVDHSLTTSKCSQLLKQEKSWLFNPLSGYGFHYALVLSNLTRTAHDQNLTSAELVRTVVREGLPKSAFEQLKKVIGAPSEIIATVIGIPARTLARRTVFKPDESGSLLRLAATFQKAIEVFEDLDAARSWFFSPAVALAGVSPLEFCDTEPGAAEVMNLLGRIEHGVFS